MACGSGSGCYEPGMGGPHLSAETKKVILGDTTQWRQVKGQWVGGVREQSRCDVMLCTFGMLEERTTRTSAERHSHAVSQDGLDRVGVGWVT